LAVVLAFGYGLMAIDCWNARVWIFYVNPFSGINSLVEAKGFEL